MAGPGRLGGGGEAVVVDHRHEVGELAVESICKSISISIRIDLLDFSVNRQENGRCEHRRASRKPPAGSGCSSSHAGLAPSGECRRAYRLAVAAVCIGAFMGQLDASIVTLAFPSLARVFRPAPARVTWVGLSYLLVLVATVAAVGRFADMVGRKLLYIYGFAHLHRRFGLVRRCAEPPRTRRLPGPSGRRARPCCRPTAWPSSPWPCPRHRLGRSLGIQGAAQALGLALGPSVGGLLLAAGGWRLIFLVNIPVGLVGMVAGLVFVPRSRHLQTRVPFDWAGFALFFPAVVALVFVISLGNRLGWTSAAIVGAVVAAVLGHRRVRPAGATASRRPWSTCALFLRRPFTAGIVSSLLAFVVLFGVLVVVPFYFERSLRAGTVRTGFELMAMPVALGLVAPLSGRMADGSGCGPGGGGHVGGCGGAGRPGRLATGAWGFVAPAGCPRRRPRPVQSPNNAGIMASVPPGPVGSRLRAPQHESRGSAPRWGWP